MDGQEVFVKRWVVKGRALLYRNIVVFEFSAKVYPEARINFSPRKLIHLATQDHRFKTKIAYIT